jgi:hypothetical protein
MSLIRLVQPIAQSPNAITVPQTLLKVAFVIASVFPYVLAVAFWQSVDVLAFVLLAV